MLVEVSDSTLATDREVKLPLYAEAGIQQVWVVNLNRGGSGIEVYSEPIGGNYGHVLFAARGEKLPMPGRLPGEIDVDEVLGYAPA